MQIPYCRLRPPFDNLHVKWGYDCVTLDFWIRGNHAGSLTVPHDLYPEVVPMLCDSVTDPVTVAFLKFDKYNQVTEFKELAGNLESAEILISHHGDISSVAELRSEVEE